MPFKVARCAVKSLSLQKDLVFRLLVTMTVLIGWLFGTGVGISIGLENAYKQWRLSQESEISIYLLSESNSDKVSALEELLLTLPTVSKVVRHTEEDVRSLIGSYFEESDILPLPIVLDVTVSPELDREQFDTKVYSFFVDARIDDARTLLEKIAYLVRFSQTILALFASIITIVMVLLVSLTIRAGLRGKKESIAVLQYVGATERFMTYLIIRQVVGQVIIGWAISAILILSLIQGVVSTRPAFTPYITETLYLGALLTPGFLVLIAIIAAWLTSKHVIYRRRKSV